MALTLLVFFGLGMHRGLLLSSDIKTRCWPWAGVLPALPLQAPALSDPVWQFVPWLRLARAQMQAAQLPLWNPHQDGGEPLLGNAQSALGSPLTWPALTTTDGIEPWDLAMGGAGLDFWNVRYLLLDPRFAFRVEELNARRGLDLEEGARR